MATPRWMRAVNILSARTWVTPDILSLFKMSLLAIIFGGVLGCNSFVKEPSQRSMPGLFVLGVDGMDPVITQRLIDEGKLPAIQALQQTQGLHSLQTTWPPQSPVAWASFVTGTPPQGHGIFDFLHRDPSTYQITSSAVDHDVDGWFGTPNARVGNPFWDRLAASRIDTHIYRIPGNYPVPDSDAHTLSGMGTVDLQGTAGVFTWLTELPPLNAHALAGKADVVLLQPIDLDGDTKMDQARGVLRGPPHPWRAERSLTVPVHIYPDLTESEHPKALVSIDGADTLLAPQQWSAWLPVHFYADWLGLIGFEGRVRVYLKSLSPLQVYISPVNIAASNPAQTISTPADWSAQLQHHLGDFYTQGMPEETNALKERLFDDADYLRQVHLVQEDSESMLERALLAFKPGGFSFFYLSDIDLQCHMLWRHDDPKNRDVAPHPAYQPDVAQHYQHVIEGFYKDVDALVAKVQKALPENTALVVMSDHGFQSQRRLFDLNGWLRTEGYLVTDAKGHIDWSKTQAYGVGFNGLYLNLVGRESQGIVTEEQKAPLLKTLAMQLADLQDKAAMLEGEPNADKPILAVADAREIYPNALQRRRPDLVVGYNAGYGVREQSALGLLDTNATESAFSANTSYWSGNHLMHPDVVPGVFLSNGKVLDEQGHARDDAPTAIWDMPSLIFEHFGIEIAH